MPDQGAFGKAALPAPAVGGWHFEGDCLGREHSELRHNGAALL